jgi:hypothetical protein
MRDSKVRIWYHCSKWFICLFIIVLLFGISCTLQPPPQPTPPPAPQPPPPPENNIPVINYMTAPEEVELLSESEIHCIASDKDKETLTYLWSASAGTINGEGELVTWTAPDEAGVYSIDVSVSDGNGGEATDSIVVKVATKPNRLPTAAFMIKLEGQEAFEANEDPIKTKREAVVEIECVAEDPDGDELRYTWAATQGRIIGEGNKVTYYALTSKGNQAVTVTVIDSKDGVFKKSVYFDIPCCGSQ